MQNFCNIRPKKYVGVEAQIERNRIYDNKIPYLQQHELETLMFAARDGFELVIDEVTQLSAIDAILEEYPNPEEINHGEETAPSKRLQRIFNYDKTAEAELIFEMLGVKTILQKCPRFCQWIEVLVNILN